MRLRILRLEEQVSRRSHPKIIQCAESLTRRIVAQNQRDRQPLDFRILERCNRFEEFIGGCDFLFKHADNVLDVAAASEKWMGSRRQDQNLNLGEFDTFECVAERRRDIAIRRSYLQRVEIWEGL